MEYNQRGSKHKQDKPTHNQNWRQQSGQQNQLCQQQQQQNQQTWQQHQQSLQYKQQSQQQNQQQQQQISQPHQQNQQPWKQNQEQQQQNSQLQQQNKQSWKQNQQQQQQISQPKQQNQQPWKQNQQQQQQNKQPWQQNQQPQQQNSQLQQQNKQPWQQNQQPWQQNELIQLQDQQNQQQPWQQNQQPQKYANQFQQPPPMPFAGPSNVNYRLPPPPTQSLHPSSSDQAPYPPPNKTPHPQTTLPIPPSPTTPAPYPPPTQGSNQNQMHTFQQPPTDLKSFQNVGPFSNTTSAPFCHGVRPLSSWPCDASPDDTLPQTNADNRDKQQTAQTMNVKSSDWNLSKNSVQVNTDQYLQKQTFIPHQSSMQSSSHYPQPGPHGKAYPPQRAGQEGHMAWETNALNVNQAWPSNMPPPYPAPVGGEVTVELTEKDEDQQWINSFVSRKINVKQPPNRKYNNVQVKIPQAKNMITDYRRLLDDLKLQRDLLVENVDIDSESWQLAIQQVSEIKRKLQSVSEKLTAPEFICKLKEKLKMRQKKTLNLKKQRKMEREDRQEDLDRIEEVDKKINADIAKAEKEREERLKEKQLQKEIDTTLFEVRKKKKEADKTLEILRGLRKLRHIRKASSLQKGVVLPISSETIFEQRISQMEQFMNRQRAVYTAEEQAMQVMLEEEQEESKEKERQMLQERLKEREVKQLHLRRKLLFGNGKLDLNVIPFNQFYKQTDVNIDAFLHVRYTWDQCLVLPHTDGASSMPVAWATPEPPSSRIWKTALDD